MKKILLVIVVCCFSLSVSSQDAYKSFSIGLKAVPSLSFFKTEIKEFKNANPKLNFGYGLVTEFHFAPNYSFLTGIELNDNGGNLDFANPKEVFYYPEGDTSKFYLSSRKFYIKYLNLPIVLKLKTNEIGFLKYYGQFGVDAGFRLKGRAQDEGMYENTNSKSTKNDVIIDDELNLLRLGLNVGLGIEYNLMGSTSLLVGLNFNNGFVNFLKKESKYLMTEENNKLNRLVQDAYNNYVTLSVGIMF